MVFRQRSDEDVTEFSYRRVQAGVRLTVTGKDQSGRETVVIVTLFADHIRDHVRAICREAGLPEPWKG